MNISDLQEARRNPDANTTNRLRDGVKKLMSYFGDDMFVSFTNQPKAGLNPQSKYSTPLGIYCYPLDDETIQHQIETDSLPFAGEMPHMNVLRLSAPPERILDLQDDTRDYTVLNQHVIDYLAKNIVIVGGDNQPIDPERKIAILWEKVYGYAAENANQHSKMGVFWNFSRLAALFINYEKTTVDPLGPADVATAIRYADKDGSGARWTHLLHSIGIDGVIDHGDGIIHSNEPTQAVFFSTRAFKVVDRVDNPRRPIELFKIKSARDFSKLLSSTQKNMYPASLSDALRAIYRRQDHFSQTYVLDHNGTGERVMSWKIDQVPLADVGKCFALALRFIQSGFFGDQKKLRFFDEIASLTRIMFEADDYRALSMILPILFAARNRNVVIARLKDFFDEGNEFDETGWHEFAQHFNIDQA